MKPILLLLLLAAACGPDLPPAAAFDAGPDAGPEAVRTCREPTPTGWAARPAGEQCDLGDGGSGVCDPFGSCR